MTSGLLLVVAVANGAGYEQGLVGHLAHFPIHCGVGSLLLSLLLVRMSILRWAACLALIVGVGFLIQVAWLWNPPHEPAAPSNGPPLRLLTFNVYHANQQHARVIDALRQANPDLFYLTEVTPDWHRAIAPLSSQWPYRVGDGPNLLLSRFPLEDTRSVLMTLDRAKAANGNTGDPILPLTEELRQAWPQTEMLVATVRIGDRRLAVAGLHLPTPRNRASLIAQKAAGLVVSRELATTHQSQGAVLLGDLNTSSFSPTFRFLLTHTQLRDSAQGYGHSPTWGPRLPREPWLPWLGTAIDHLLVSKNISVSRREIGPSLGSDHRWVLAEISW